MNRNMMFGLIVVLVCGVAVLGYQLYQERQNDGTVELKVQENGIKLEAK